MIIAAQTSGDVFDTPAEVADLRARADLLAAAAGLVLEIRTSDAA